MNIYLMDIDELIESDINLWVSSFNSNRISAVNRKTEADRLLSICGDLCLLKATETLNVDYTNIKYNTHGKPYFEGNPIYFSISHKGTKAVCVTSNKPIGVDLETIKPFNKKVAERICTESELSIIGNDEERFATVWAVKEAYSKLDGRGISLGLKHIITNMENCTVETKNFSIKRFGNYVCAIVSEV